MVANSAAVKVAVKGPPALHRYVETVPDWLVATAERVLREYEGDAARIWNDYPRAAELRQRFEAFKGIGQNQAAMAVEILERDLGVPIRAMHGSDIAYDIHVRRVFLRTRLAERDDLEHMVAVAREAYPDRPGAIDFPAWLVGRQWCRAGIPDCPHCVLTEVCPKDVARAANVVGV
jgi:endonuclease III